MKTYTKIIRLTGNYFTKELIKKKHHQNKLREVSEDTVAKFFLEGNTEVLVCFQETEREVMMKTLLSSCSFTGSRDSPSGRT